MKTHELKCWSEPFHAVLNGQKTVEWRYDDRGYEVGDTLLLREWEPPFESDEVSLPGFYVGLKMEVVVTHIVRGPSFGIPEGYVMMSIQRVDKGGDNE